MQGGSNSKLLLADKFLENEMQTSMTIVAKSHQAWDIAWNSDDTDEKNKREGRSLGGLTAILIVLFRIFILLLQHTVL